EAKSFLYRGENRECAFLIKREKIIIRYIADILNGVVRQRAHLLGDQRMQVSRQNQSPGTVGVCRKLLLERVNQRELVFPWFNRADAQYKALFVGQSRIAAILREISRQMQRMDVRH